ncbi:unnamed protein product, partial [Mesorhabditis belari]|uniref:Thioredoxin domain-containing protein n=1 Tax=Mesorhabditis belari TaxID=2138241 RepID=A0AAF3FG12_9BILA
MRVVLLLITVLTWAVLSQDVQTQQIIQEDQHVFITAQNHDQVLQSATVVFVAFCAEWCPFSRRLKPVWEEAARVFKREHPDKSAVFAIVDSVANSDISDKYFVNKYPTMKVFVNGEMVTKEYRGTRSTEALTHFVLQQLSTAMNEFPSQEYVETHMDRVKRNVIAYLVDRNSAQADNLKKVAMILKDECSFWLSGPSVSTPSGADPQGNLITFLDPDSGEQQKYTLSLDNYDLLKQWLTDKCIPLVREVTFENVEELTEEGLPFLIYFRDTSNRDGDRVFSETVIREISDQKGSVNPLFADGKKFAHPLKHLGKTQQDLPVLAIDSFQHMFLFPDMNELTVPGKLRQFVMDLHSGKLHKEFHESLDQKMMDLAKFKQENGIEDNDEEQNGERQKREAGGQGPPGFKPKTDPPPSVFKELKPSGKRYSLLSKTEL